MNAPTDTTRRTVLETLGASLVGGVAIAGSATAHDPKNNGQIPVFPTWGDNEIWELIDAEPPSRDRFQDAEGNDNAHASLYVIPPIPGGSHSPMFGPFDQVIPVPGGTDVRNFSAQWHPKLVLSASAKPPFEPSDLVNEDQSGTPLTSATRIKNATNVQIAALPEETVFTCPVRPHRDRG